MRVAVLGCGAMGTILGAFLAKNGCNVEMIDSYEAHVKAMNESGIHVIGTQEFTVPVKAVTPEQMQGIYDIVFLLTKQTANGVVLPNLLPHLSENSTVCTLQNGVPEPYVAQHVGKERAVGGTVLWGATFIGPGISELTQDVSNLETFFEIGEIDGTITDRIKTVAEVLGLMGHAEVVDCLMSFRWGKLVNNACMSGMSAACNLTFGQVLENDKARACLSYLSNEVLKCCEAQGLEMPMLALGHKPDSLALRDKKQFDENQEMFIDMYQAALTGKASMLQDLEKGRQTEVNMINGYVTAVGKECGIPTPFNDTVVKIVTGIENKELPLSAENVKYFEDAMFSYWPSAVSAM